MEELKSLNEAYFGKTQALLDLEDYITELRARYPYSSKYLVTHNEEYKELLRDEVLLKKIPECLVKTFGFNDVALGLHRTTSINASTIVYPIKEQQNKPATKVNVSKYGFSFDKNTMQMNIVILATLGLFFPRDDGKLSFTPAQIVAVLMHEIGHAFSPFLLNKEKLTDRVDEKFADQFAGMYGYSKEIMEVVTMNGDILKRMNTSALDRTFKDVPVLNILGAVKQVIWAAAKSITDMDCHPNTKERLMIQIRQMESDLKNDPSLSSKSKKELEDNIISCKKYVDQVFNTKDDSVRDSIIKFYYNKIEGYLPSNYFSNNSSAKLADPTAMNKKIADIRKTNGYFVRY